MRDKAAVRAPTPLEERLLEELRYILVVFRERLITPKNYMKFMGELKEVIKDAEDEIGR